MKATMLDPQQLLERQRVLADFGEFALRTENLDETLTEACRLVGQALGTRRAKILEIQHDRQCLLVRAGVGWDPGIVNQLCLPLGERSSETFSIEAGKPVITQDITREERFEVPAFMRDAGVVALANAPILLPGGRPYGLLQVDSTEPRDFGPEDAEFLRTYATILGPVIDRLHKIRELQGTERRFRLVVEAARDYAIFLSDAEDRVTDWLPGAEAVFGWTAAEVVGQPSSLLFTPEAREAGEDAKEVETARRHGVAPNRGWHLRKDGTRVFIEGSVRALRDDNGQLSGFLKIGQDVTEQRRVEEQLRESEARQRALIEGMPQMVWRAARAGEWVWSSPQWRAHTGLSVEASQGWGWLEALHPSDRPVARAAWRAAETDGLFHADYRLRHAASGHYRWFQARGVAVRDARGEVIEWLGTSTDIDDQVSAREVLTRSSAELEARIAERTADLEQALHQLRREALERQEAEVRLKQSEKLKAIGQLTGGIAHDFNNMLQGIVSGLSMVRARTEQQRPQDVPRYLDRSEAAAARAAALVQRLLAFSRQQSLAPEPVNLNRIAQGMEEMVRRMVGPAVQVELQLADGHWLVLCDPSQMESALLNLCVNARDAMPEGGWLTISTEELLLSEADVLGQEDARPGRYAAIAVTDTGTGMPPEIVARVFEPFFTTKPSGQGTGLGLSQIYGFVRQSGGLVQIETAPGNGTTVRLCLPFHGLDPDSATAPGPGLGKTVLLVEDEPGVRELTAEQLRDRGYRVLEAESGPAALRLIQAGVHVDLLISDYGLPGGMNGRQVIEAARERHPELPVVLITGYASIAGLSDLETIRKPFDPAVLIGRVAAKLGGL